MFILVSSEFDVWLDNVCLLLSMMILDAFVILLQLHLFIMFHYRLLIILLISIPSLPKFLATFRLKYRNFYLYNQTVTSNSY